MSSAPAAGAHTPVRTCLVCMSKRPGPDMVRLALEAETGRVVPDVGRRMQGRGAYACAECLDNLRLNKRVQRAFRGAARELCLNKT
ncbi:MAG: YlxR family protein [Syntrophobacteraceae bacterium]